MVEILLIIIGLMWVLGGAITAAAMSKDYLMPRWIRALIATFWPIAIPVAVLLSLFGWID